MNALSIPTDATTAQADTALTEWLRQLPPLAPDHAALMGATLRAGGAG